MVGDYVLIPVYYGLKAAAFDASAADVAIGALCSSTYFDELRPFGFSSITPRSGYRDTSVPPATWADPSVGFRDEEVEAYLKGLLEARKVPSPGDPSLASKRVLYVIVLRQGMFQAPPDTYSALGKHLALTFGGSDAAWAWVFQGGTLDGTMPTVAHEIVEAIASDHGADERTDFCKDGTVYRIGGVVVEPYLGVGGVCVVPGVIRKPAGSPFVCAWKGHGDDEQIYFNAFYRRRDNAQEQWDVPLPVPGAATSHAPSLCLHSGEVRMVWKGAGNDTAVYWSSLHDGNWLAPQRVPGAATSNRPAVASFNGSVVVVSRGAGDDDAIWWTFWNGWEWGHVMVTDGLRTDSGVALASARNLYMLWKGPADESALRSSMLAPGSLKWTPAQFLDAASSDCPSVTTIDFADGVDHLLLTWKGADDDEKIWQSSFDGAWQPQRAIDGVASARGPGIAMSETELLRVWRGAGDDETMWYATSLMGENGWRGQQVVPQATCREPPVIVPAA